MMRSIGIRCLIFGMGLFTLAATAQAGPNTLSPTEKAHGWKLLFDGQSLDGWQPYVTFTAAATGDWTVADGAIVCPGTSAGWLGSNETFTNFELKLQFRAGEKTNSGVFLRSEKEGAPHKTGYELQIWDYQPAGYNTGSLVGSLKAMPATILDGQWNDYDITADGDHYVIILNGKTILDGHDAKHTEGVIGFQCQKGNKIEFRDVRLLSLQK